MVIQKQSSSCGKLRLQTGNRYHSIGSKREKKEEKGKIILHSNFVNPAILKLRLNANLFQTMYMA